MEIGSYTPDNLLAGDLPRSTQDVTLAEDQTLVRGTVLGIITTGGQAVIVDSANADGSQVARFILAEDTTVAAGETAVAPVYRAGEFNEDALVFGGTDTADTHRDALREKGIFLSKNQPAVNS